MIKYLKLLFLTHIEYLHIYLISLFLTLIASVATLISIPFTFAYLNSAKGTHVVSALIFSIISTSMLIIPNYSVASKYFEGSNKLKRFFFAILNQLLFIFPVFIVVYIFLKWFIWEF